MIFKEVNKVLNIITRVKRKNKGKAICNKMLCIIMCKWSGLTLLENIMKLSDVFTYLKWINVDEEKGNNNFAKHFVYVWPFEVRATEEYLYMECTYVWGHCDSHKCRCIQVFVLMYPGVCAGGDSNTLKGIALVAGFSRKKSNSW